MRQIRRNSTESESKNELKDTGELPVGNTNFEKSIQDSENKLLKLNYDHKSKDTGGLLAGTTNF